MSCSFWRDKSSKQEESGLCNRGGRRMDMNLMPDSLMIKYILFTTTTTRTSTTNALFNFEHSTLPWTSHWRHRFS